MKRTWPHTILFVRHPQSDVNVEFSKFVSSDADVSNYEAALTKRGIEQAKITKEYIMRKYGHFDARFTSTFSRTGEMMSILYPREDYVQDPRINERNMGVWHKYGRKKVIERYPDAEKILKREGIYHHAPVEGGESCANVETRVHSFLTDLRMFHSDKKVLVVTHGALMLCVWRILSGKTVEDFNQRYRNKLFFANASILCYKSQDGLTLNKIADGIVPWDGLV